MKIIVKLSFVEHHEGILTFKDATYDREMISGNQLNKVIIEVGTFIAQKSDKVLLVGYQQEFKARQRSTNYHLYNLRQVYGVIGDQPEFVQSDVGFYAAKYSDVWNFIGTMNKLVEDGLAEGRTPKA